MKYLWLLDQQNFKKLLRRSKHLSFHYWTMKYFFFKEFLRATAVFFSIQDSKKDVIFST